jgi:hypothetical protein
MRAAPTLISSWSGLGNATVNIAPAIMADNQTISTQLTATAAGLAYGSWAITSADADF